MKLTVGITQLSPEWKILINQIGVSYEDLHPIKPIKPDQASVIIVTEQGLQTEKDILLQYINTGGSITKGKAYARMSAQSVAHLLMVLFIIIGNIAYYYSRKEN